VKVFYLLLFVFITNLAVAQSTIGDARRNQVGTVVTVSGIVINGDELGTIRYIQDSTGGIGIYDSKLANVNRGDSITVTGELADYYNLLEIKNVSSYVTHSTNNSLPEPIVLTIDEIGEDYEGRLVKVDSVEMVDPSGTFSSNNGYDFTDGSNSAKLWINSACPVVGEVKPSGSFNLVGICSQHNDDYELLPRDMDDIISKATVNISTSLTATDISQQSVTVSWETDIEASSEIRYGSEADESVLMNLAEGSSAVSGESVVHSVEITGLQAAEIIYAQAFSVSGTDTAFSAITPFVTESNSSGTIRVYFNSSIDESYATESVASNIVNGMADTLAAYINMAEESIDLCIYNFNNSTISDALNAAYNKGVQVRLITCGSTAHVSVGNLNAAIPVLERPEESNGGIMHNKFAIIDCNSENAWLWAGSTNLTEAQLTWDSNNMIFIQDQSLAKTYKLEFEEMWGSNGTQPNASNARFGEDKTDNTPHSLLIGGKWVECYFSPSDETNQKLIDAIGTSDNDLNVETMLITRSDLANEIVAAYQRGVDVNVITDDERTNTETVNNILRGELPAGKCVFDDTGRGTLHHKVAIIDASDSESDPQVITGSHNWSNSANTINDENTLIIHDADIANQYYQQFVYRFEENEGMLVVSANTITVEDVRVFPNPTTDKINVTTSEIIESASLFSVTGELLYSVTPKNQEVSFSMNDRESGLYILVLNFNDGKKNSYKIVKK